MSSSMDDSSDRSTVLRLRSDQERERRRMRDRERRRSMTSEQKERHLARRRRNYQLRTQRVKHRDLVIQLGSTSAYLGSCIKGLNCRRGVGVHDPKSALEFNYAASVSSGKEPLAYDLTKLLRRLRLMHVKHFARSLKLPLGDLVMENIPILTDLITRGNQGFFCKSANGVHLNRIKQMARGYRSAPGETYEQLPLSEAEGNLEKRKLPLMEGHQPRAADETITGDMVT